jgi:hypothetical protein
LTRVIFGIAALVAGALAVMALVTPREPVAPPPAPAAPAASPAPAARRYVTEEPQDTPRGFPKLYHTDVDQRLWQTYGYLKFTVPQRKAWEKAGDAIFKGAQPTAALTPEQVGRLQEIDDALRITECPHAPEVCRAQRIDFVPCLDQAAVVVAERKRKRGTVGKDLFEAAIAVAVNGLDRPFHTGPSIVDRCLKLTRAQAAHPPLS